MRILGLFLAMTIAFGASAQQEVDWLTDYTTALEQAAEKETLVLLNFSGSDWCPSCMRLEKELFSQEAFQEYAENLVLLKADFPARKANALSPEQTAHNEMLAEKYNKKGAYPLTVLLDAEGNIVAMLPTTCDNLDEYLSKIQDIIASN